jgi:hypothetical protein
MPLNFQLSGVWPPINYAIAHAIKIEPKASEVAAKKDLAHHPFATD